MGESFFHILCGQLQVPEKIFEVDRSHLKAMGFWRTWNFFSSKLIQPHRNAILTPFDGPLDMKLIKKSIASANVLNELREAFP